MRKKQIRLMNKKYIVGSIFAVALAGLLCGQVGASLGFGRSAGLRSALGGAALGLVAVVVVAYWV